MHNESKLKACLYKMGRYLVSDSLYTRLKFRRNMGYWPDLKNPRTFNEKLCWLKLHDHNPLYTTMVDKYEAKRYVADIIGEEYIIPTLGVWDRAEDIDFDSLPDKFVLKTTHDSGSVLVCKDKAKLDRELVVSDFRKALKRDFYAQTREWPYKNVKPRIIAEMLLENKDGKDDINDYKFFCFGGEPKFFKIDFDRQTIHRANYYDMDFRLQKFGEKFYLPDYSRKVECPENLKRMVELAKKISKNHPFLRVDFYNLNGKIYLGELTFFPNSGTCPFTEEKVDYEWGGLTNLS